MKKQILTPMILVFFFLIGEVFAGNGMMNRAFVNSNLMPNLGMQYQQPDSASMKTHPNMKSGNMMMKGNKTMKCCDSARRMKMMEQMGNMNMQGMDSASRSRVIKKHIAMMKKMMNGNKTMKCDSAMRMKMMMEQMGKMHGDSTKHK